MSEVRSASGVPVAAQFAGLGAPTQCAPLFVDFSTGWIYSLKTGDVVVAAGMGGTVTSVALTAPSQFSVSGSPVTGSGTLALAWQVQVANRVLSGPSTGADAVPTFRALVNADLPATAVTPASYTYASITVNQQGVITSAANGTAPVTSVGATAPITTTGGTTPTIGVTAAALTKTDDTNVTLTLGGTPTTALLAAASLTLGWTGQLSTTRGGTGQDWSGSSGVPLLTAGTFSLLTGVSGSFTSADAKTITVTNGVITAIV